ncbi:hypothetical protein CHUAL_003824 [Chamberlinius hualienensis]
MAEIPDLTFKMGNKPPTPGTKMTAAEINARYAATSVGGAPVPAVKLTQTVPIHILRVEDKSSMTQQQMGVDPHGRSMGVASSVPGLIQPVSSNSNTGSTRKKTGSSFQITSVTDGSRLSNDGGDDSADDLDESHTDDLSSEMGVDASKTDYDYSSSDAFSSIKDDPLALNQYQQQLHHPQTIVSTTTTTPQISLFTSTNSDNTAATTTAANVSVTVVESPATVPMSVVQNPDIQWQNRFRVVKIESSEPFRRGRWLCMDFLDPPPPTSSHGEVDKDVSATSGLSGGGNGSGNSSGTNSFHHGDSLVIEHGAGGSQAIVTSSWSIEPSVQSGVSGNCVGGTTGVTDRGPLISNVGVNCDHYPVSIILQTQQQAAAVVSSSDYACTSNVSTTTVAQEYQQTITQQQQQQQTVSSQVLAHHQVSSVNATVPPPVDYSAAGISTQSQPTFVYPTPVSISSTDYSQQPPQPVTVPPINSQIGSVAPTVLTNQQLIQQVTPSSVPEPLQSNEIVSAQNVNVPPVSATNVNVVPQTVLQQGTSTANITVPPPTAATVATAPPVATVAAPGGSGTAVASVVSPSQETADGSQQVVQTTGEEGDAESLKALAAFLGEGHKLPGSSKYRFMSTVEDGTLLSSGKYR